MELLSKDGSSFYVPIKMSDKETQSINSFKKWARAFRVHAGVYSKQHPHRAWELLEYINSIETAAETFTWENMYCYDQIFRDLMEEFPYRNWGVIYQQTWSIILKDNHGKGSTFFSGNSKNLVQQVQQFQKVLRRNTAKGSIRENALMAKTANMNIDVLIVARQVTMLLHVIRERRNFRTQEKNRG